MLNHDLLGILRCPNDRSALVAADEETVSRLNAAIRAGSVTNQAGRPVRKAVDGGLVRGAGDLLYPIVDQIPVLLFEESIAMDQFR